MTKHNHLAVLTLTLLFQPLGALYYSPIGFGNLWLAAQGFTPEQDIAARLGAEPFIYGLLGALGLCYFLSFRVQASGATTFKQGAQVGLMFFLGAASILSIRFKFLGVATSVLAMDLGFTALTVLLASGILAVWRKQPASASIPAAVQHA